ncbi:Histidine phosphatase superfamily clade-1 protein [Dioscorea alata]|uniref:Histidine phosphatase superfamily clade-1 protein n=2 Tax=Dioscorea alata TaxID=55571 RepID=A0ACB7UJ68_DIOAL|nr:Histidine phosphatase superfamily clade-1 protein [Dioscorea alata]KAH7660299.1 Histidine phosphatase superfamily clade-1 protein [Dioscorea alata]
MRLTVLGCCCSNPATAGFSFPKSPTNPNPSNRFPARSTSVATAGTEASDEPSSVALPLIRRRLILLRHAESTFVGSRVKDHERPLSKPGRRDAMSVAHKLEQMGWIPEVILSSDATRTKETLQILQETAIGFSEAEVYFIPSFYSVAAMDGQTAEHLQSAICEYSRDESLTVMCMGHNRGWEEAATMFSGASVELKTCNAALLEAAGKSWEEAFSTAGLGGWKLHGIVKPDSL